MWLDFKALRQMSPQICLKGDCQNFLMRCDQILIRQDKYLLKYVWKGIVRNIVKSAAK